VSIAIHTVCKSNINVNHLHLQVQIFYTCTYPVAGYIYIIFTLTWGQCKYLSHTLTRPLVNVLGCVSVNTKIICKVTLSLGLLSTPNPSFRGIHKIRKLIRSGNEMLKISNLNAQGSRLIIVALQVMEALRKRRDKVKLSSPTLECWCFFIFLNLLK
jgi:hypothetical protein